MTSTAGTFELHLQGELAEPAKWLVPEIRSVPDVVRHWARVTPDRLALQQGDRRVTYAELDADSNRIAQALLAAGAGNGAHVGHLGKNHHRFFAMWFGKAASGIAPFNWRSATAELVKLIEDAQTRITVAGKEFVETLHKVQALSSHHLQIVAFSADGSPDALNLWLDGHSAQDPRIPLTGSETTLGISRARRFLLLGGTLDADEALSTGLVDFVVDDVRGKALEAARRISRGPTKAYGELRRLFDRALSNPFETHLEDEAQALARAASTADAREGITAFGEKRKPVFQGR